MDDIAAAIGSVATAIGAVVAVYAAWDARRSTTRQRREAVEQREEQRRETARQQRETEHQAAIALEQLLAERDRAVQRWADEVIDELSRAHSLGFADPETMSPEELFERRSTVLWRLSSLLDRGRLFFPNIEPDAYGAEKAPAYRGIRQAALDHIKYARDFVKQLPPAESVLTTHEIRRSIIDEKRSFVSEIQKSIDPRDRQRRLQQLMSISGASAKSTRLSTSFDK